MTQSSLIPYVEFNPTKHDYERVDVLDLSNIAERKSSFLYDPENPHRVGFYLLIFIESGKGDHFVDFSRHAFKKNDFILINRNQVHAFDLSAKPQGKVILFTDEFLDQLRVELRTSLFAPFSVVPSSSPVFRPGKDSGQSCQNMVIELNREFKRSGTSRTIMASLLSSLLQLLERAYVMKHSSGISKGRKKFDRFILALQSDYTSSRDASDYARKLSITYKTLNTVCKQYTNRTAKHLIDDYVVLEAKRRLILEEQSVQEIAFSLGFEDASNFVKFFKRRNGMTPRGFRKKAKG